MTESGRAETFYNAIVEYWLIPESISAVRWQMILKWMTDDLETTQSCLHHKIKWKQLDESARGCSG